MIEITLILMILFAIVSIQTSSLRHAIIYLCIYSLLSSFCYLLFQAPDVAIAEAVIGCTLSTILFLVALKQYKVFRVYYCTLNAEGENFSTSPDKNVLLSSLKHFSSEKELDLDFIETTDTVSAIENKGSYDIIISQVNGDYTIFGSIHNYHYDSLKQFLYNNIALKIYFDYIDGDED